MARKPQSGQFNVMIVGQGGRVGYEALVFAASLAAHAPELIKRLFIAEPQPGPLWPDDPRMSAEVRTALTDLGATVVPFENRAFGNAYPNGNKIEGLSVLPEGEPFVFFDSDTLVTGDLAAVPFDFARPSASMRREGTWPEEELYWPGYTAIWKSLYDRFGLEFESTLDTSQPDEYWQRYMYFNAGWFFHEDPKAFGERFLSYATEIENDPPEELAIQPMRPWLDQIALPLVIQSFGGGRPGPELAGLDGDVTCHWRMLPLLYARESDRVVQVLEEVTAPNRLKKVLKGYDPIKRMVYQGRGQKVRALFDRDDLPRPERKLRNQIKKNGFWMR
ncbi:hypothetical protein [Pelagovum pacificum]|uniref:Uncharacterized protein n=1 Tax=Pelagovum pacificum TaxID=2588711 RepID=A0A5C5GDK6_9RHOB|nr:hypothetical protein [Pelagovum pacificum]QQA44009.1 hypothetical protein I8N54_05375 [Pelagovum pacificum]TNY32862.1 hypothetical protein FHY64_06185 [Pelagovum pacificum]